MDFEKLMNSEAYDFLRTNERLGNRIMLLGLPFISLPDQIFLPFLGGMLSNNLKRKMIVSTDKMMPATQCLFLYLLYQSGNDFFIKKQAADDLGLTKMSITRASEQLKQMDLIRDERVEGELQSFLEEYKW